MATASKSDEQARQCLTWVDELTMSGQISRDFASARGLNVGQLRAWCAHAPRWRARLAGQVSPRREPASKTDPGFVQATLLPPGSVVRPRPVAGAGAGASSDPSPAPGYVRIECVGGQGGARSDVLSRPTTAPPRAI